MGRSVLSDGKVICRDLAKAECDRCLGVTHVHPLDPDTVSSFYRQAYALPHSSTAADRARAESYASWLLGLWGSLEGLSVLEVGCGSGALLRAVAARAHPRNAVGFDPALAISEKVQTGPVRIYAGSLGSVPAHEGPFDLVYSVNVIEHVPELVTLLEELTVRLRPAGRMIFVCPAAYPNLELLFLDHVATFTPAALAQVAARAGCRIAEWQSAPDAVGDFQLFVIEKGAQAEVLGVGQAAELSSGRTHYLQKWRGLDRALSERLSAFGEVAIFGAGESTALLRAYAPETWRRIAFLTVDDPSEAWAFEVAVRRFSDLAPHDDRAIIVGVKPGRQSAVADRLSRQGHRPVTWEQTILERWRP